MNTVLRHDWHTVNRNIFGYYCKRLDFSADHNMIQHIVNELKGIQSKETSQVQSIGIGKTKMV